MRFCTRIDIYVQYAMIREIILYKDLSDTQRYPCTNQSH